MSLSCKSSSTCTLLPTDNSSSFLSTASSTSSTSSQSSTSSSSSTWPTIQPTSLLKSTQQICVTQEFCSEIPKPTYPKAIGVGSSGSTNIGNTTSILFDTDEHHVSFSKNGTEILDFEVEDSEVSSLIHAKNILIFF